MLLVLPVWFSLPGPQAAEIQRLHVERQGDLYRLSMSATLDAPPDAVWRTLKRYDCLHRLTEAVQRSETLQWFDAETSLVQTHSRVCVWIFCKHLQHVQYMQVINPGELKAVSLDAFSDFHQGLASWRLLPEGEGTRMLFQSQMEPDFWVPPLIGPLMIEQGMRSTALETLSGLEQLSRDTL